MAKNAEKIIKRYGDGSREENRNSGERADYIMEYKYTKKLLNNYISPERYSRQINLTRIYSSFAIELIANCIDKGWLTFYTNINKQIMGG